MFASSQTRRWLRFGGRRLANALVVLATLIVVTFLMVRLIPGDPAARIAGADAAPEYVQQLRVELGLDQPVVVQFLSYFGSALRGDFGRSYVSGEPVSQIIAQRLPFTLSLAMLALATVLVVGFGLGLGCAIATQDNRNRWLDQAFTAVTGIAGALPEVIAGTLLVYLFAVQLQWFPISGARAGWTAFILPALAIALRPSLNLARVVRVEAANALGQDYMRAAVSKRLGRRITYLRHLLPNVMTGALTMAGILFSFLVGGAVVVENIFAWPGLGTAVVRAVISGDYPVVQGVVLLLGLLVILINTLVDVALGLTDPRSLIGES
jgi:peptide/nickel transport system permease protein